MHTTISDEERRDVAGRLKGYVSEWRDMPSFSVQKGVACSLGIVRFDVESQLLRLADLIYPSDMLYVTYSRSTCGPDGMAYMVKVRHRARGLERDFYAVDLKKLLEVLDEMEITVKCAGPDVPRDYVENWANEVREALGANYG